MDIKCAVCNEPWDIYGVSHGDMAKWEAALFKRGAGCPSCEGHSPLDRENALEVHLHSVILNSDDPDAFEALHSAEEKRPEWKRPEDPLLWQCAGVNCRTCIRKDCDTEESYVSEQMRFYGHRGWRWFKEAADPSEAWVIGDESFCPDCATTCDGCGVTLFHSPESQNLGDVYDAGYSFPHPHNFREIVCVDCLSTLESECEESEA